MLTLFFACLKVPGNFFVYSEAKEINEGIDLIMQLHDFICETDAYYESYTMKFYKLENSGEMTFTIDSSYYNYSKKFGKGNYPNFEDIGFPINWLSSEIKSCMFDVTESSNVTCNLTRYVFN
tara:strand:- start:1656 stop:2021 length:366 start_codon:yes stop_codon:yes gene_type:complete